mmetsp:Transcript_8004/g.13492  ORF Transcript_8004/g.13492 Transcript_8004/m.13492 type:complete len:200 (-) Transcript_8004:122-721(-)
MSAFPRLAKFRNKISSALGKDAGEEEPAEPTAEEIAKAEEDAEKSEYRLILVLEKVREMYFQRRLVGEIEVSRSLLFAESSICCEIDGTADDIDGGTPAAAADDVDDYDDNNAAKGIDSQGEEKNIPMLVKAVVKNSDRLLNRLAIRARKYKDKDYKGELTLTGSISITDPMGFTSMGISCTASLESLLESSALQTVKL